MIWRLTECIDGPTGTMIRTASNCVPPAEAASTTVSLQEIVKLHSEFWNGVWSAPRMCLRRRTNRLEG